MGCEYSQIVTQAFRRKGHDAWSCDLLPTEGDPDYHIQGDVLDILEDGWDMAIFHPYCTYSTNAANRWLYEDSSKSTVAERLILRDEGIEFFLKLKNAPIEKIAIENPEPHPYVISKVGRYQDKVQPWMFGDPEKKGICLWLKDLPPLISTIIESEREAKVHRMPPGPERSKARSRFFPGVADAMAEQWG